MPSLSTVVTVLAGASMALAFPLPHLSSTQKDAFGLHSFVSPDRKAKYHEQCHVHKYTPFSCTLDQDTCCYEATNGLFLATQFWDYNPATGPDDLFTTHGLWSDRCNGTYGQYCNPDWEIENVTEVLHDLNMDYLLAEMNTTWKNQGSADEDLWLHEFNKHGTCMSTVNPSCYRKRAGKYQYVGDFFKTVVALQEQLPTYKFLAAAGITPTNETTYNRSDIEAALANYFDGNKPYLGCDKHGALDEVWYYLSLKGSVADGDFYPLASQTNTSCPEQVYYLPKGSSVPGSTNTTTTTSGTTGTLTLSGQSGCIISDGTWFTSGTCATFTIGEATFGGVTLTSSKGPCNVVNGALSCASGNTAAQFTQSGTSILYNGEAKWSGDHVPASQERVSIVPGTSESVSFTLNFIAK